MESFSSDTLFSSSHSARRSDRVWSPVLRPVLSRAPPPRSWHMASDSLDPLFIAPCPESECLHINFARNHAPQGHPDSFKVYPSPPSSSSIPKPTVPLPEETGEFAAMYSTHLAGVLDSPPVMRRADLASQKPLTPPPTIPQTTLNLPDADLEIPLYDQEVEEVEEGEGEGEEEEEEEEEEEWDFDEFYPCSPSSPSHPVQPGHPLSPLSPTWDSPCTRALSIASPDFAEPEHLHTLFARCDASPPPALDYCHSSRLSPPQPFSLLEVDIDAQCPFLTPISIPWDSSHSSDSDPEPPSSSTSTSSSSLTSLTDYDELSPPSSPLISRLDLPDLEDDGLPKIVPFSPSRRSCSSLPDSDIEMGDSTSDPVLALPGQQLLSLPGADTDDDLIPRIPVSPSRPIPFTPSQPLLFIDDPRDVPLPRSPSPEDFDLCLSPEDITDPELARLFDLRKRSIAAERAARRVEALTDDVDLFTRAEARKIRKRERERSKEVGALLRLKLGDGVATCPQERSPESDPQNHARRRGVIGDMSQLVAQMVFRRSETARPLAKRKMANTAREYASSPLSDAVSALE
ncbi:hypothetical protein EV363DRAFT_363226 [Boletus edulis]|uniref:Uncharacterized protein n=1 Tax=Boletus edulis BED1 TaxID=1328754 RepID=A0AAD4BRE7_BOLED|nr:hypothetical protein EV363DRAFT_1434171 [Boletus edulis]KAF8129160.1 hypothetical protein EV363DRAFT_363226 [Boletus edulis]KAF8437484.1 hypothetical protein L210DRAFT_2329202 [Boletus edulis BED1]